MVFTNWWTAFVLFITPASLFYQTWASPLNLTVGTRGSFVPFGALIDRCTVSGTVALTFDDGPYIFTPDLLELLSEYGARSTFFLNGQNLGSLYGDAAVVQRILEEGHQVGSHTWGHPYLTSLDYNAIVAQMTQLEAAFISVLGFYPTYMRPPYFAYNELVLSAMGDLGYHVIMASIDTKDYENDHPDLIFRSFEKFRNELNAGGSIVLAHDVHEQTVTTLTRAMLEEIRARGLQTVTVGQCLGDPKEYWYRTSR
ncbi:chitin deacetylase [Aspergillus clavatus NRRL 1]|uniref:Polysaccharide deacetylase family protein n=1 Tax=Aspergillus clavatus (strain ATCC 1007 / CBS 513.65 / DSM 816 / NCTC 3887 / NRRL 1 / QM 1276 / 107) TaxID=344612 RepID=A1CHT9_ASPCL|nr:polysaccharide deacetylase family protein [Aspergillus clavatus NRRL 1]EAW10444.1 polysaccharide deacetylase family protein [Aspergillus clavatus NRRL 1]